MYPVDLSTEYAATVDWPPVLRVTEEPFTCDPLAKRAGKTEQRMVDGRAYCVTAASEGAAGSTYTLYTYAWRQASGTASLTLTLRQPQCANYDDLQRQDCENERAALDLDSLVDRIAGTVQAR
jgi:hypothetical protein